MTKLQQIEKKIALIGHAAEQLSKTVDSLREQFKELSPANEKPRQRKNLKEERFSKYHSYITQKS